jgi:DNA-binding MarR family transcriptional regulator
MAPLRKHRDADSERTAALATELRVVMGQIVRRLRQEANFGDFTFSQQKVLLRLEREGPATVTSLAAAEGVRSQSMGATIAPLKEAGLVAGTPDPNDGRQTVLSLTPACLAAIAAGRARKQDWLFREIDEKLSPKEQETVAAAVELLRRLTQS